VQNVKIITSVNTAPTINGGHHYTVTNGNGEYGDSGKGTTTQTTNGPSGVGYENTNCPIDNPTNTMLSFASNTNATTSTINNNSINSSNSTSMAPPPLLSIITLGATASTTTPAAALGPHSHHHHQQHPYQPHYNNVCTTAAATVSFMDIKSAAKAHTAEHKFDDRLLTTEYYEPTSLLANEVNSGKQLQQLQQLQQQQASSVNCLNDMKSMGQLMPGNGGGVGTNSLCDNRRFTPSHGLVFLVLLKKILSLRQTTEHKNRIFFKFIYLLTSSVRNREQKSL
jgi:hypothetical protein